MFYHWHLFFMFNKVHTINLHPQLNYKALHMIKIQIISPTTLIKFYLFKRVQVNSYAVQITSLTGRFTKLITTFKADALSVSHIQKVLLPQLLPFTCWYFSRCWSATLLKYARIYFTYDIVLSVPSQFPWLYGVLAKGLQNLCSATGNQMRHTAKPKSPLIIRHTTPPSLDSMQRTSRDLKIQ